MRHDHRRIHVQSFLGIYVILLLGLVGFSLTACNATTPSVFGSASNHMHSFLLTQQKSLLLATHEGIFRSTDNGHSWTQETGGNGTGPLGGLMTYSLVQNTNTQTLFLLTQAVVSGATGTPGLYTSTDDGVHWKLLSRFSGIGMGYLSFLTVESAESPSPLFIYIPDLGTAGLKISNDGGSTFQTKGTLPFAPLLGLTAIPNIPGTLLAYGPGGIARSTDDGLTWQTLSNVTGSIYEIHGTSLQNGPLYASGDAGIYRSMDNGTTFQLVESPVSYNFLTINPANTNQVFGKTGSAVYESNNGGQTWQVLPAIHGNLANQVVLQEPEPTLLLSLSYPVKVEALPLQNNSQWTTLAQ